MSVRAIVILAVLAALVLGWVGITQISASRPAQADGGQTFTSCTCQECSCCKCGDCRCDPCKCCACSGCKGK